jgi:hypothetical protein
MISLRPFCALLDAGFLDRGGNRLRWPCSRRCPVPARTAGKTLVATWSRPAKIDGAILLSTPAGGVSTVERALDDPDTRSIFYGPSCCPR